MEKKEMYLAPEVEILEVMVEKGFAASPGNVGDVVPGGGGVDLGGGGTSDM